MRLLIFAHCNGLGGAQRSLLELVRELTTDHGVACTVVLPTTGSLEARLEACGAETAIVPYGWWCDWETTPAETSAATVRAFVAARIAAGAVPDVVLTISFAIPWGAAAAAWMGVPHVWYVHETGANFAFELSFRRVIREIDRASNAVLAVSYASAEPLRALAPGKVTIARVFISDRPERVRDEWSPAADRPIRLLLPGTITPHKGQDEAIAAVAALARAGHAAELTIMGSGAPGEIARLTDLAAKAGVSNRVRFAGFHDRVWDAMAQADVVLVCSRRTALDRVMFEGMLVGTPVVAARSGGAIEGCQDGACGLLYTPGAPDDLAAAILRVQQQPDDTRTRLRAGRDFVARTFSPERYGGTVFRVLTSVVGATNPAPAAWPDWLVKALRRSAAFRRSWRGRAIARVRRMVRGARNEERGTREGTN